MRGLALAFGLIAFPAVAETPLTIEEFEAVVTGKLIAHYRSKEDAEPFGVEEYLPGRRSRWAFTDDVCVEGTYYETDGWICFDYAYDYPYPPQCWQYFLQDGNLTARFQTNPPDMPPYELRETKVPLPCAGPDVGA